ncbi:hypothetical protein [Novosphingobium decolorationis]|uniref:Secreted protein n=1 Tax=Novosphingobium decolorationis TaxID=2698673 RepID=A0ABX8EA73_9SPHN|nr:hypothetical protein [Novosphingobium decolorationis]QVM85919.1 hypothetical protein HT578_21370 [Novosphingobium decolorationis]
MTAFAASLFALAGLVSLWVIGKTLLEYAAAARGLTRQLQACSTTLTVSWSVIERPSPHGDTQRGRVVTMGQAVRQARRVPAPARPMDLAA